MIYPGHDPQLSRPDKSTYKQIFVALRLLYLFQHLYLIIVINILITNYKLQITLQVYEFVKQSSECGVDVFRIFDSLNFVDNMLLGR